MKLMQIHWNLLTPVLGLVIFLVVYVIWRNRKDEKSVTQHFNDLDNGKREAGDDGEEPH